MAQRTAGRKKRPKACNIFFAPKDFRRSISRAGFKRLQADNKLPCSQNPDPGSVRRHFVCQFVVQVQGKGVIIRFKPGFPDPDTFGNAENIAVQGKESLPVFRFRGGKSCQMLFLRFHGFCCEQPQGDDAPAKQHRGSYGQEQHGPCIAGMRQQAQRSEQCSGQDDQSVKDPFHTPDTGSAALNCFLVQEAFHLFPSSFGLSVFFRNITSFQSLDKAW